MTDAHIRPEEYRPQWKYRRIVIWSSIAYSLLACAWLVISFVHESRRDLLEAHESGAYVLMTGLHILLLIALIFQYVWGAIQQLRDFFGAFAAILGNRGGDNHPVYPQPYYPQPMMAHGPQVTEAPDADGR